jgi:hypothetical protein
MCRAAAAFEPANERASRIHAVADRQFDCECYNLSRHSPGPVDDAEVLNFLITDPQSLDPRSRNLLPVIARQVYEKGMSVLRDRAADIEFELTYFELKRSSDAKGKERFLHGVCAFRAREIRYDGNSRFAGIYDTGLRDRPHHADIMAPPPENRIEKERSLKKIIDKIGPGFIDVNGFRNGAFRRFGRSS